MDKPPEKQSSPKQVIVEMKHSQGKNKSQKSHGINTMHANAASQL